MPEDRRLGQTAAVEPGYEELSNRQVANETLDLQANGENLAALIALLGLAGVRRVLDVGCGTGAFTRAIGRALGPGASVTGIDVSEDHIEQARRHARREGAAGVDFVCGDFLAGEAPRGTFDLVVEKYLLMYQVGTETDMLRRMAECLGPGGRVGLIEADIHFGADRYPPPPEPLASLLPRVVSYYRGTGRIEWRSGAQLFHHLRRAGFRNICVHLADGRVMAGGHPRALVEHAKLGAEELLAPCLEGGSTAQLETAAEQWRAYLDHPDSFLYTPVFVALAEPPAALAAGSRSRL